VFNGRRQILQSILVDDADDLFALTIEEETGQIATCDKGVTYVYQPLGRDYGDLRWYRAHTLTTEDEPAISSLSWGSSSELLVAGERLTLWNLAGGETPQAIWSSNVSTPVSVACFSPDAGLIASCGQHDRVAKVWRRLSYEQDSTRFDVSYLPHPSAVLNMLWRNSWHNEQNLENLLYTFCADNQIRVWAHLDHHAYTMLQKVATIDANISIQPRRLSMGSISKSRTSFILASRDLAQAAGRALHTYRQASDHALEHLIEIANRSPEVCVILDGRGHMSSWGIQNAGLKNKLPAEKSNLALVDGVDIALPSGNSVDEFAQIHAFANNDVSASLCILVHSYSGQIDWYQGSFVDFFDTAVRPRRTQHVACWSGHDSAIDRMVSAADSRSFLSLTDEDQVILWSQGATETLVRSSEAHSDHTVLDAALLDQHGFAVFLHPEAISLWDMRSIHAKLILLQELDRTKPKSVQQLTRSPSMHRSEDLLLLYENGDVEQYSVYPPDSGSGKVESNGYHGPLSCTAYLGLSDLQRTDTVELCISPWKLSNRRAGTTISWSESGLVQMFDACLGGKARNASLISRLATQLRLSNIGSCLSGRFLALVHADYRTVSVWDVNQGTCAFAYTFSDLDLVQELHWHTTSDGLSMLAVQFAYSIATISQERYSLDDTLAWKMQQVIPTRRHSGRVIGSLCWLEPCHIAVGLGNQILTFDLEGARYETQASDSGEETKANITAEQQLRLRNSSLPIFSPRILGDLLQVGQYSAAGAIIEGLHNELRFHTSGEPVSLDDGSLLEYLVGKPWLHVLTNGGAQSPPRNGGMDIDLEDVQFQIDEKIPMIASWQIQASQQGELRGLLSLGIELMREQKSLDASALTYVYHFLVALGKDDPTKPNIEPLPYSAIVHASLSNTQDALLRFIDGHLEDRNIKFTWSTARTLGIFLWVADLETLKIYFESVARAEYNRNTEDRNPVDCSLYYLALDKKAILQSLWRRTVGVRERENTMKLLAHDFREQRWKSTALKNAYALLSKRRFEYGAAFFLLGGSLSDAVNVCVNQLHDVQLAIAIARVWQGDSAPQQQVMGNLLDKTMLGLAIDTHEARWMAIWACTYRQDWIGSLSYVVKPTDVLFEAQFHARRASESDQQKKRNLPFAAMNYRVNEPTLLVNLYKQLRAKLVYAGQWTEDAIAPRQEWDFVTRCVQWYVRAGMDWLALRLVATWEFVEWQEIRREESTTTARGLVDVDTGANVGQKSALDDWLVPDKPATQMSAGAVDTKTQERNEDAKAKPKPPPTQFIEPSADSLLDSFGF